MVYILMDFGVQFVLNGFIWLGFYFFGTLNDLALFSKLGRLLYQASQS